jgi:serine/threonine protein kinase
MIVNMQDNSISGVINDFEVLCKIEEGVYGKVYKVCRAGTDQIYAVKEMKSPQSDDGVPHDTLREIFILRDLDHENVLK